MTSYQDRFVKLLPKRRQCFLSIFLNYLFIYLFNNLAVGLDVALYPVVLTSVWIFIITVQIVIHIWEGTDDKKATNRINQKFN